MKDPIETTQYTEVEELDPIYQQGIIKFQSFLDYKQFCKQVSSAQKGPYMKYCNVESPKQIKRKRFGSFNLIESKQIEGRSVFQTPEKDKSDSKITLFKSFERVSTAKKQPSHNPNSNLYRSQQSGQIRKIQESQNKSFIVSTAQTLKLLGAQTRPVTNQNPRAGISQINYNKRTHSEEQSIYKSVNLQSRNIQTVQQQKNVEQSLIYPHDANESLIKGLLLSVIDNNGKVKREINLRSSQQNHRSMFQKKYSHVEESHNQSLMSNGHQVKYNESQMFNPHEVKDNDSLRNSIDGRHFKVTLNNSYMNENRKLLLKKNNQIQNSVLIWDKEEKQYNFEKKSMKEVFKPKQRKDLDALTRLKMEDREHELDLTTLTQPAPLYEDLIVHDWEERNFKSIDQFQSEIHQKIDLKKFIEYSGQLVHGKREGLGGFLDSQGNFYYGQWIQDQKCGYGISFFNDKRVYKGYWLNDKFNGLGIIKYPNQDITIATFESNDIKEGVCQILYNNEDWYVGQIVKKQRSGKGTYYYKNGDIYIGEWKNGKKHGEGELKFINKRYFKGKFKKDEFHNGMFKDEFENVFKTLKHAENKDLDGKFVKGRIIGYGRAEYANKEIYVGQFKDGKRSGHGKMAYQIFNKFFQCMETGEYEGQWKFNLRHGQGVMKWADGSKFEGEWNMDKRLQGLMYMKDGSLYKGAFKNELFHGKAEVHLKDQNIFIGKFVEGKSLKFGKLQYKSGEVYMGEMISYRKEGAGILIRLNGDRYEGSFSSDQPTGFGTIYYNNGDCYIGEVQNFKRNGKGRMYHHTEQEIYEGQYLNDERDGNGYLIYVDGKVYCGQFSHNVEHGVGEYLLEKDVREIQEVDLLKNRFNDIQVKIYHGCRDLGFPYKAREPQIIL